MHQAVIGARPQNVFLLGRFSERKNDVIVFDGILILGDWATGILLLGFVVASQIRADFRPGVACIVGAKYILGSVINDVGIVRRNDDRHGPRVAVLLDARGVPTDIFGPLLNTLSLAGGSIVPCEERPLVIGIDNIGVSRVGN